MWQITIDGPAASGKSYIGTWLAQTLNATLIDTGLYYRAFTWWCLQQKADFKQPSCIVDQLPSFNFKLKPAHQININGRQLDQYQLQSTVINQNINQVASLAEVRAKLTNLQQQHAMVQNCVMVGRDAGTVILPAATCKIFLTATPEVRAMRRLKQDALNNIASRYEDILQLINRRDVADRNRKLSPLKPANDALMLDNSNLTIDQTKTAVRKLVVRQIKGINYE